MPLLHRWAIFLVAAAITCVFFINFCNFVFECGCTYLWAGSADHCNIHHGPKRCPWCAVGSQGQGVIWLSMILPQAAIAFRSRLALAPRLVLAILAFPGIGFLAALITGYSAGYWD